MLIRRILNALFPSPSCPVPLPQAKMEIQGAEQARRAVMAATEHLERERAAFERLKKERMEE